MADTVCYELNMAICNIFEPDFVWFVVAVVGNDDNGGVVGT